VLFDLIFEVGASEVSIKLAHGVNFILIYQVEVVAEN
jgi:hypothetical protein